MTSQPDPHPAPAMERQASLWTPIATASALVAWVGGPVLGVLGPLAILAAVLGLVAATIAVIRDHRTAWRVAAAFAGLASLAGLGVYAALISTLTL